MPSPEQCALKFKPGTQEYKDCIAYKGKSKGQRPRKTVKPPTRGGY